MRRYLITWLLLTTSLFSNTDKEPREDLFLSTPEQIATLTNEPTGVRIDGGHEPSPLHQDPRSHRPHGHVPGITNADGTPWLEIH